MASRGSFNIAAPGTVDFDMPTRRLVLTVAAGSVIYVTFNGAAGAMLLNEGSHEFLISVRTLSFSGSGYVSGYDLGGAMVISSQVDEEPEL